MAKSKAQTTRSVFGLVPGAIVTASDMLEVYRALNSARIDFYHVLLNESSRDGFVSISGSDNISNNGTVWPPDSTIDVPVAVYTGWIYIDPDYEEVVTWIAGYTGVTTTNLVDISMTIGSDTETKLTPSVAPAAGGFTLDFISQLSADTGTGWQQYLLTLTRKTADTSWGLVNCSIHGIPELTVGNLPDPDGLPVDFDPGVPGPEYWWDATRGVATDGSGNVTGWTDVIANNTAEPRAVNPAYNASAGSIYVPNEVLAANHEKLVANNDDGVLTDDFRFLVDGSGDGCTMWVRLSFRLATASENYLCGIDSFTRVTLYLNRRSGTTGIQGVLGINGSVFTDVTTGATTNGVVYDVFLTVDPSTAGTPQLRIYLDSTTPAASANVVQYYSSMVGLPPFAIGGTADTGNEQTAEADFQQVALYNKVLTADEMQAIMDWSPA